MEDNAERFIAIMRTNYSELFIIYCEYMSQENALFYEYLSSTFGSINEMRTRIKILSRRTCRSNRKIVNETFFIRS